MGVVHKLLPQVKELILAKKKSQPVLSCRQLSAIIQEELQVKISKSTISALLKEASLSLPVGRRLKRRRRRIEEAKPQEGLLLLGEIPCLGAVFLKAADYLAGGMQYFAEAIKNRLKSPPEDIFAQAEYLLYSREKLDPAFLRLSQKAPAKEVLALYLNELQGASALSSDLLRIVSSAFKEVRCIKVILADGTEFCLDGQLHTIWSTPQLPYDFSSPLYNVKQYISRYFQENLPFILFMASGYDSPTKEFFNFLLSLDPPSAEKRPAKLILYGNGFEELEVIRLPGAARRNFIFGLWPWQFAEFRKVKSLAEFRPLEFIPLNQELYSAAAEIELSQPHANYKVTLRGCALKRSLADKVKLVILSNLPAENSVEDIARMYLQRWPSLEEAFQDYSRKVERFTYTASSRRFFSAENLSLRNWGEDLNGPFNYYLRVLDLSVRWHFLPTGYEEEDFSAAKERFYSLAGSAREEGNCLLVKFNLPAGYPFLKELNYACRRVNERGVLFSKGKRLWLENAF